MAIFAGFHWPWGNNRFTTITEAQELLGLDRVYESERVMPAWGKKAIELPVLYPTSVLKHCVKENTRRKEKMDWRLVYGIGLSLRQQFEIRGDDPRFQPCFYDGNTTWRLPENRWTIEVFASGYYLINFRLLFKNYKMSTQDLMVSELGKVYSALLPQILSEVLFSIFMLTKERLLQREIHSSPTIDAFGYHVKVGYFDSNGLTIGSPDYKRIDNGVVTHIRPHIPADPTS